MLRNFDAFYFAKVLHLSCRRLKMADYLKLQLLRASSSVALNVAEGSGKRTAPDQRRFYGIALGSLRECEAILELEDIKDPELRKTADRLGAILYTLSKAPENRKQYRTETDTETETGKK